MRSPDAGIALPVFDTRASTTTLCADEMLAPGAIAIESSSTKSRGNSRTVVRSTASGIRGPLTARAKMNTVSVGAAFAESA